jgi:hypothetical protein
MSPSTFTSDEPPRVASAVLIPRQVGLRNPASLDPIREKGDKVFRQCCHATTGFFSNTDATDTDDFFPDDDYFPDIFGNMGDNINNVNGSSSTPYVFLFPLIDIMLQFLVLVFSIDI